MYLEYRLLSDTKKNCLNLQLEAFLRNSPFAKGQRVQCFWAAIAVTKLVHLMMFLSLLFLSKCKSKTQSFDF